MTPGLHSTDGDKPGAIGLNGRARFNTYGIGEPRYEQSGFPQHDERRQHAAEPGFATVAHAGDQRVARTRAGAESRRARVVCAEEDRRRLHGQRQRPAALQRVQHPHHPSRPRARRPARHRGRWRPGDDLRLRSGVSRQQLRVEPDGQQAGRAERLLQFVRRIRDEAPRRQLVSPGRGYGDQIPPVDRGRATESQ